MEETMRRHAMAALGAAFLILLGGCGFTPQGDAFRSGVAEEGRAAAAAALENAEWLLCRALPVGAIKDRYGRTEDMAAAYDRLCNGEEGIKLIGPRDPLVGAPPDG
jgi:hypothetical protein